MILPILVIAGIASIALIFLTPLGQPITQAIYQPALQQAQDIPSQFLDQPKSASTVEDWLHNGIDWIGEALKPLVITQNMQPQDQALRQDALDSGIGVLHSLTKLWTEFHAFIVNALFAGAGSNVDVDRGTIAIIGFVVTFIAVVFFGRRILKEWKWIVAVVLGFIMLILIYGWR